MSGNRIAVIRRGFRITIVVTARYILTADPPPTGAGIAANRHTKSVDNPGPEVVHGGLYRL
jgi:hypothetical protein